MSVKLTVELNSVGNIDYGQNPYEPLFGVPRGVKDVETLEQASATCRAYIQEHGLGGSQWSGGKVYDHARKQVAYVSYNGRIWSPDGNTELV